MIDDFGVDGVSVDCREAEKLHNRINNINKGNIKYFWVRVYDYVYHEESDDINNVCSNHSKGTLLDEFYIKGDNIDRDHVKSEVKERYKGKTSENIMFAKPKKRSGMYAIVMDSDKFFYDRFYASFEGYCFWHECHKHIKGNPSLFPRAYVEDNYGESTGEELRFCSYECRRKYYNATNPYSEGEFQLKEAGLNGSIFGYIYLIYNRLEDTYYVGQTRFMPFFRWQEHVKTGQKGDIKDLVFSVLTEVPRQPNVNDNANQEYLNNIEAWWIKKYREEGYSVFNISNPKITISYLKQAYNDMIAKTKQLDII